MSSALGMMKDDGMPIFAGGVRVASYDGGDVGDDEGRRNAHIPFRRWRQE